MVVTDIPSVTFEEINHQTGAFTVPISEMNRLFESHDAKLSARLKRHHPRRPYADIVAEYPNHWVALRVTAMKGTNPIHEARLFFVHPRGQVLRRRVARFREKHPEVLFTVTHTAPYVPYSP